MADILRKARHLRSIVPAAAFALMVPAAMPAAKTVVVADLGPPAGDVAVHRASAAAPRERHEHGVILLLGGDLPDPAPEAAEEAGPAVQPAAVPAAKEERLEKGVSVLLGAPSVIADENIEEAAAAETAEPIDFVIGIDGHAFKSFRGYCDVVGEDGGTARRWFRGTVPSEVLFEGRAASCAVTLPPVVAQYYTVTQWADGEVVASVRLRSQANSVVLRSDGPWGGRQGCLSAAGLGGNRLFDCNVSVQRTHGTGFVETRLLKLIAADFTAPGRIRTHGPGFAGAPLQRRHEAGFAEPGPGRTHRAGFTDLGDEALCFADSGGSVPVDC